MLFQFGILLTMRNLRLIVKVIVCGNDTLSVRFCRECQANE